MSMGNFLGVQWFELCASSVGDMGSSAGDMASSAGDMGSSAGDVGSMPSQGNKILQTIRCSQKN